MCGNIELLSLLRDHGAELSQADNYDAYPIHYAAQMCEGSTDGADPEKGLSVLRKLLSLNVQTDVKDQDGRTPLLWAASSGLSIYY